MTTYAVISDIHGDAVALQQAIALAQKYHADFYLILGDLLNHGPRNGVPTNYDPIQIGTILNEIATKAIIVKGNCDSEVDEMVVNLPINATYNTLIINNHKCFMTHGHKFKPENAKSYGLNSGDLFLSGHTHVTKLYKDENGIVIFNPGSITFPKGINEANTNKVKTFGIISDSEVKLISLDDNVIQELKLS